MPEPTHAISREWIHAFYRAHHRALAAYAASLTRSRDDAEDLVHEALAGMLEVRGAIENPEAYAYRAIRNRAIDRARRVFARPGQSASVEIGREIAVESMQPTTQPGVFRLVPGEPKFEGMRFDVLAEVGKAGSVEVRKFTVKFDQMVGREKVEGTSLEVGAPIMRSRESTHALGLNPGQRAVLTTSALDGSDETLLVVLEAVVVEMPS